MLNNFIKILGNFRLISLKPSLLVLLVLPGLSSFAFAGGHMHKHDKQFEYAVLYVETEGEFIVPVGADIPAIYSWVGPEEAVKGEVSVLWKRLGIERDLEYSFNDIEYAIINHLAAKNWRLNDLEINSVPVKGSNFRTSYRYIFERIKHSSEKSSSKSKKK